MTNDDRHDLQRFLDAQEHTYARALAELRNGRKQSHWMWFIFPQIEGLGQSTTSRFYAIKGQEEAQQYLKHPILGARLVECAETLLAIKGGTAAEIFGFPDNVKLKSCMTLFETVAGAHSVFSLVLERYFGGKRDSKTLDLLHTS